MNGKSPASGATTGEGAPAIRARPGRVCQEEGCHTRLSIYNDGSHCSVHAPMVTPRTRGKKIA